MKTLLLTLAALASMSFSGTNKAEAAVFDVTCTSYGYQQTCDIANFERATLIQQLSYAPCVSMKSFRFDRRGIHVWGGCSAIFRVETSSYHGPHYPPHHGGYHPPHHGGYHPPHHGGYNPPRPHRPRPPVYNPPRRPRPPVYNPPHRGPRNPHRPGRGHGGYNRPTDTVTVKCHSVDRRPNFCHVRGQVIDAWVINKKSDASCARGRGYEVRRDGITVKNGCRAKFKVSVRR